MANIVKPVIDIINQLLTQTDVRISYDWDSDPKTHVVEIRGDIFIHDEITETLDSELSRYGSAESVIYYRINDVSQQRALVERLGLAWEPEEMPWLLVLQSKPQDVSEGDKAIQFRLRAFDNTEEIRSVTTAIIKASRDPDFMKNSRGKNASVASSISCQQ